MDKVLEVQDLNVTYVNKIRRVKAVRNANFTIYKGDSLGIVGESGSGKSTMAMAMLRLLSPKTTDITGRAEFMGKDLLTLSDAEMNELRWSRLSVVFQKAMNSLSPVHRISTQIEDIYKIHEPKATKKEIEERMSYLLKLVNLPERVYKLYPHEMSGGMLQRMAIAISLMHSPQLIIFDEATTALDVVTQGQILEEIIKMEKTLNMTRMMITHDMSVVASTCNKVVVMYAGELVEMGLVSQVLTEPKHPYTRFLIEALPKPDPRLREKEKQLLQGDIPSPVNPPSGCRFHTRCPYTKDICKEQVPELKQLGSHLVACHFPLNS
jgi:peptide/nickel transport system ATP-binding protein